MHPKFQKTDWISKEVISAVLEVGRSKGSGLLEQLYPKRLARESHVIPIGVVIHFHQPLLKKGIGRLILQGFGKASIHP